MPTCSFSVSATATSTAIPTSSSSTTTTSPSLSKLSFDYLSLTTINFSIKAKPIKLPRLRTHFPNSSPFSRSWVFSTSAAFQDGTPSEAAPTQEEEESGDWDNEGVESLATEERRLYVGNLPYSMTSPQLTDVFAEAGRVISVEVIYNKVTRRSRGFAFVTMGSVEEAKEAIRRFEGSQFGGRTIKVNFPEVPKGGEREVMGPKIKNSVQFFVDSPHKIYAGNLSWGLTSQGLRDAFSSQPGLLSAKVIYDRDSGRSRGFGFVTFASAEEVESALSAMNGAEVQGRPLRLNLSEGRASTPAPEAESNSGNESVSNETLSENASESSETLSENESDSSEMLSSASV